MTRVCVVVNPRSGGGRTARRLGEIERAVAAAFPSYEIRRTEASGHATALAREAADQGFDLVVAVGGDGTASEVVNGLVADGVRRREGTAFGVVNAGTGGDLVKTLRMPRALDAAFAQLAARAPRPIDLLRLRYRGPDGADHERICVNVTGWGLNGEVVRRANHSSKRWGGRITFARAALTTFRDCRPLPVRTEWVAADGTEGQWSGPLLAAFLANGAFCGGGIRVGPDDAIDDGAADLTLLPELPLLRAISAGRHLFGGTIERVKEVSRLRVRSVCAIAETSGSVAIDVDGEQPGELPLRVDVIGKVLKVAGY